MFAHTQTRTRFASRRSRVVFPRFLSRPSRRVCNIEVCNIERVLQASGCVSTIALWGHSMGAATSLLYASGGGETLIRRLDHALNHFGLLFYHIK